MKEKFGHALRKPNAMEPVKKTCDVATIELMPRASVMIEAMRDIGYSFDSAVADIIDNSIAAGAKNNAPR